MKKIILLLVILSSCGPSKEEMERLQNNGKEDYYIKIIDGCEYIDYQGNLTHKANCKNHK